MKRSLSSITRRLFRRGQTGQTIVILAFGFIVLLGFVGIVTDVSLMFVRYSTLRRAIDAAAVSAAGQMRRGVPTDEEENRAKAADPANWERIAFGYAYARNVAQVNLAARQFLELYGVNPTTVLVDTCATTLLPDGTFSDPELECEFGKDPRKLVRVTAQVESPTVFLRLLGWGTVTLEATAISETAVLDVILIFDVSESMSNQTTYDDWDEVSQLDGTTKNLSMRYYPPRMSDPAGFTVNGGDATITSSLSRGSQYTAFPTSFASYFDAWLWYLNHTEREVRDWSDGGTNPPGQKIFEPIPFWVDGDSDVRNPTAAELSQSQPRADCRVRAFPGAGSFYLMPNAADPFLPENDVRQELGKFLNMRGFGSTYPARFDGFVPAFNYFGCCNDPSGDGDFIFDDLVCQPMKKVRTATEAFLERVDFSRGDRVGFVTFDRTAYLIDPDGAGPNTHMISAQVNAIQTLREVVGVRAEGSYYADVDQNGQWDSFVKGGAAWSPGSADVDAQLIKYEGADGYNTTRLGFLNDYPVKDNCIFQNATLRFPFSLWSSPQTDIPGYAVGFEARFPTPLSSYFQIGADPQRYTIMHPNLNDSAWEAQTTDVFPTFVRTNEALYSYELRAACRGSNVGAALRTASSALNDDDTERTNGAVWVMVMLGDGAAAGSDPVRRGGDPLTVPNVYNATYNSVPPVEPIGGDYGVFGVCPYGNPDEYDNAPLLDGNWERAFPYCSDKDPEIRHFCFDPDSIDAEGKHYIDIADSQECEEKYDVDDFARDWADFIGLADPYPDRVTREELEGADPQLPTIFTIGFGLDFQQGDGSCDANPEDCVGEELLRYIADVGDNNRIDTDYQQDWRANGLDGNLAIGETWGVRGPCEGPILLGYTDPDAIPADQLLPALHNPLPEGENCGNYFNAPDEKELENVFDTIASRMFTRLTR